MKRTHRIYNELGLQLRNKTPKRRVKAKLREDRCAASRVNDVWASAVNVWRVCAGSVCHRGVCVIPESRGQENRSSCNVLDLHGIETSRM
ncbi:hypothetical protein GCM10011614_35000 [Novosphingobium colocasiae]|uniref:HTH-like domain-containing protein n=1 Tax=Novosphingobium colocasiae TaxID=1256513 RepID=A0A918UK53_9SPHN|nr:hypothetical protein GCM10011614_35000 [Novosphingobium colocasiae]